MKKILSLILIAIVALAGSVATVDAAPKKKKSAARRTATTKAAAKTPTSAGLTIDDFVFYAKEPQYGRVFAPRDADAIVNRLQRKGFDVSHRTETREDETGAGTYEADIYTLSKSTGDNFTSVTVDRDIYIRFPSDADAETFMNGVKTFGYRYSESKYNDNGWHDPSECYYWGTDIFRSGNVVKIELRWEA